MTLEIRPDVAAKLQALAARSGLSVEGFIEQLVGEEPVETQPTPAPARSAREGAVRRMLEFGDKHHLSLGEPITRALLHEGHRY